MRKIDTIEIQKQVEERRLILGKKFEEFLLKKLGGFLTFFGEVLAQKSGAFFGAALIIAISALTQSSRDIGHDSVTYIEIAQKMLKGGKYYEDFFELNFPLSFWITLIPVGLAKFFNFCEIIATEIFVNLVGILSLYCSYRILSRTELSRKIINLLIWSYAAAFFLRVFTLQFNEMATKSTYFIALALPYISYQLLENFRLKKIDQTTLGILAALIFALKPNYGILVLVFEFYKLFKSRKIAESFCLRNYTTLILLLTYAALIFALHPQYIENFSIFSASYYQVATSNIYIIIKEDIFPLFLFCFITLFLVKEHRFLRIFQLTVLAISLIVSSELIGGYDQRFALYSLGLPLIILSCYFLLKENYFDFRRYGILLLFLLFLPLADAKNIFALALDLPAFWFVLVVVQLFRKNHVAHNFQKRDLRNIFLPKNFIYACCFAILAIGLITLSFQPELAFLAWGLSAVLLILQLGFYQEIHQHKFNSKRFSALSAAALTLVLSYFLALHISAIFNLKFHEMAYNYKSPNHLTSEMINSAKGAKGEVVIISQIIPGAYPVFNFMEKVNPLPALQMPLLYYKITKPLKDERGFNYLFSRLKAQLKNDKNELLFVEIKNDLDAGLCQISFLEFYMRDKEFREIFLSNYRFSNRIIQVEENENEVKFFDDGTNLKPMPARKIKRDVEVYVRK